MRSPAPNRQVLFETIETQRLGCELSGSPLSAAVLEAVATDVSAQGVMATLLDPVADAPFGDAVLLRLLAGLHRLVLDGRAPGLGAHYPSIGGMPHEGLHAAVIAEAHSHLEELRVALSHGVQTNEVGRSAAMLGGYLEVARDGLPLRVLEVGSSAGLNLMFDRYRYVTDDGAFGPESSPLVFDRPWLSGAPDLGVPLVVADRRGCDVAPINISTEEGRQRLRSFVWADQLDRLARLDAALQVARSDPPEVDQSSAPPWLAEQLAEVVGGTATVVAHSIMFQYLSPAQRDEMVAVIDAAGGRAHAGAPLAWLRLEPGGDQAELRLTRWPGGETVVLARSSYHGPPVVWFGPGALSASGDR